jgi:hypothetical protein
MRHDNALRISLIELKHPHGSAFSLRLKKNAQSQIQTKAKRVPKAKASEIMKKKQQQQKHHSIQVRRVRRRKDFVAAGKVESP